MKLPKKKKEHLMKIENWMDLNQKLQVEDKTFEKLMFLYSIAMQEIETKVNTIKEEFKLFYDYNLMEYTTTRIKDPQSIVQKMKKRKIPFTYQEMIENIHDIAGVRIVCPLKKDIFTVRDCLKKIHGINVLKEKDYITYPKKSGYSSYHLVVEVPVSLSQNIFYVKVEIQIRTISMDFWANLEHKVKYKSKEVINAKKSKEWVQCAKMIHKLDHKMLELNS